jgi:hypothetical protein
MTEEKYTWQTGIHPQHLYSGFGKTLISEDLNKILTNHKAWIYFTNENVNSDCMWDDNIYFLILCDNKLYWYEEQDSSCYYYGKLELQKILDKDFYEKEVKYMKEKFNIILPEINNTN